MLLTDKFETFLFDWDGTLANTINVWLDLLLETYAEYGKSPDRTHLMENAFGNWESPRDYGVEDVDGFNDRLFAKVDDRFSQAPLFESSKTTLESLAQQGKKLALLTSNSRHVIDAALEFHQLQNMFASVVAAQDVDRHKPDPGGLELTIGRIKAEKQSTVMVGDSHSDIAAAKAADVTSVLLYPKQHKLLYSQAYIDALNADFVFSSPADILTASVV